MRCINLRDSKHDDCRDIHPGCGCTAAGRAGAGTVRIRRDRFPALGVLLITDVLNLKEALGGLADSGMLAVAVLCTVAPAARSSEIH